MIGILTPYSRSDTTAAAIRLADVVISLGEDLRLIACGQHDENVHPFWDNHVLSGRYDGIYLSSFGCDQLIHFQPNLKLLVATKLSVDKAKQLLIAPWHTLSSQNYMLCKQFDRVVLPGKAYSTYFKFNIREKLVSWCLWDSGLPGVKRLNLIKSNRLKVCFYCDAGSINYCSSLLFSLWDTLLSEFSRLDLLVFSTKSWSRKDRCELKSLTFKYESRFTLKLANNLQDQLGELHKHDWLVYPSVRSDFGMPCLRAHACGLPVIAHNIVPFSEIITQNNGLLVPCEVTLNNFKAPVAVPNLTNWLSVCRKAFKDNTILLAMHKADWRLTAIQSSFNTFWEKILTA